MERPLEPLSQEALDAMIPPDHIEIEPWKGLCIFHGFMSMLDPVTRKPVMVFREAWSTRDPHNGRSVHHPAGDYPSAGGMCEACLDLIDQGWTQCPAHGLQPPDPSSPGACTICGHSPEIASAVAAGLEPVSGEAVAASVDREPANLSLVPPDGTDGKPGQGAAAATGPAAVAAHAGRDGGGGAPAVVSGDVRLTLPPEFNRIAALRRRPTTPPPSSPVVEGAGDAGEPPQP